MSASMEWISFAMSLLTGAATFYFWLVRASKERPRLTIYQIAPIGAETMSPGPGAPPKTMRANLYLNTVVANDSTTPNALLGVRCSAKLRDGNWRDGTVTIDSKTPIPSNISPMQTMPLDLTIVVVIDDRPSDAPSASRRQAALDALSDPVELIVEMRALGEHRFRQKLIYHVPKTHALRNAA